MPALSNQRHERFAQELAKGKSQLDAYAAAGYRPDRGAATRLSANVSVQNRRAELQERVATRTELTVASLTERLMRLSQIAEDTGMTRDEETGEIVASSAKHIHAARAAAMDAARLNGLVIDRSATASVSLEDLLHADDAGTGEGVSATTH